MAINLTVRGGQIIAASLLVFCGKIVAAENHWTGGAHNNFWTNAGNWSLGILPNATQDVFIDVGTTNNVMLDDYAEAATFHLDATLTISNGTLRPYGAAFIGSGGLLNLDGQLTPEQSLTVDGTIQWLSGTLGSDDFFSLVTLNSGAHLNIVGPGLHQVRNGLDNLGVITCGSDLLYGGTCQLTNRNLFLLQTNLTLSSVDGVRARLENLGTIEADGAGTTRLAVDWEFNNRSSIVSAGSVLEIQPTAVDVVTLADGTVFEGPGTVRFPGNGSSFGFDGVITADTTVEHLGYSFNGHSTWEGPGTLSWQAGTLANVTIAPNFHLEMAGDDEKYLSGTCTNLGIIRWRSNGPLDGDDQSFFVNANLVLLETNLELTAFGSPVFANSGTILRPNELGAGSLIVQWVFTNSGTLFAGTNSVMEIRPTSTDRLWFGNGTVFDGAGVIRFPGESGFGWDGSLMVSGTIEYQGYSFNGAPQFHGPGTFRWLGGTLTGVTFGVNFHASIEGSDSKYLAGACTNLGILEWRSGGVLYGDDGSRFVNNNLLLMETNSEFAYFGSPVFQNNGTIEVPQDLGVASWSIGWLFTNNATLLAETNSVLEVVPGGVDRVCFADGSTFDGDGVIRFSSGGSSVAFNGMMTLNGTIEYNGYEFSGRHAWQGPGNFVWLGGTLAKFTFAPNFHVAIVGDNPKNMEGACTNLGIIRWRSNGPFYAGDGAYFANQNLFLVESNLQFASYGFPLFENRGTLMRPADAGVGTVQIGWQFVNDGTVNAGTNSVLELQANWIDGVEFVDGSVFDGDGIVRFPSSGYSLICNGALTVNGTVEFSGYQFTGSPVWEGTGNFLWLGGTMNSFTFAPNFHAKIQTTSPKALSGSCTNDGMVSWCGDAAMYGSDGSAFQNDGYLEVRTNGTWDQVIPFRSTGTLRQTGGLFSVGDFANSGTLELAGGQLSATNAADGASAAHVLVLRGQVQGTDYGFLNADNLVLNGPLSVVLTNSFVPTNGSSFVVATDFMQAGRFSGTALPVLPDDLAWKIRYTASSVLLSVQPSGLTDAGMRNDGTFEFTMIGAPGSGYDIQASTNLVDWVMVETNYPFSGQITFDDFNAAQYRQRYYRGRIFR
jgi:hypothetical protein